MTRQKYDDVKEHEIVGWYPPVKGAVWVGPEGMPASPRYYHPVEARENFKMLFQGKRPYWIADCGPYTQDITAFRPRQHPDNLANHQAFDGGDYIDFQELGNIVTGWLDIEYEWEPTSAGATPKPGIVKIPDINKWEEYVTLPDLDKMDWEGIAEMNKEYLDTDRVNQLGLQFSFWERLMNTMSVSEAAMALIDEDQTEGIHRFFDSLANLYIDYIRRICKCCRVDAIVVHDDWGHQNGPFFSLDTCREMIVPYFKKVIDVCHELGLVFEHHCCGKAELLVPAMIDAGVDYWMPQPALNDLDKLVETYRDSPITFAVSCPKLSPDLTDEQINSMAEEWVDKYKDEGILLAPNMTFSNENDFAKYPVFKEAVYKFSRIAYQDYE